MRRKLLYGIAGSLGLALAFIVLRKPQVSDQVYDSDLTEKKVRSKSEQDSELMFSSPVLSYPSSQNVDTNHREDIQTGIELIFDGLKQMGAMEMPSISDQLDNAVATDDPVAILRAFEEVIYGRFSRMDDAIPAIKEYLDSPDLYLQYLSAEALLRVGDKSGVQVLIDMTRSESVLSHEETDLRLTAATALAQYRVRAAAASIQGLYSRTKDGELLKSLASLGFKAREADQWPYVSSRLAVENYAKEGSVRFIPNIANTFEQSNDSATRNAAAWALARMTGDQRYLHHLIEAARPAIEAQPRLGHLRFNESTEALRYIGSIQSSESVRVLEQALESQNPVAVRYATVNLLFNQPSGSEKAKQLLIKQFEGEHQLLPEVLIMQMASSLNDVEVRNAAQSFARRTGGDQWRFWVQERSEWSIYGWIHDYVVDVK